MLELIERTFKTSVYLLLPFLGALFLGLLLLGISVSHELAYKFANLGSLSINETILFTLKLVDVVLLVNLIFVISLASYKQLLGESISTKNIGDEAELKSSKITLADMKQKLLGSALAISVVSVLSDLVQLKMASTTDTEMMVLISKAFVVAVLAIASYLNSKT